MRSRAEPCKPSLIFLACSMYAAAFFGSAATASSSLACTFNAPYSEACGSSSDSDPTLPEIAAVPALTFASSASSPADRLLRPPLTVVCDMSSLAPKPASRSATP